MDFEDEALELVVSQLELRVRLLRVRECQVDDALEEELLDLAVFADLATDLFLDLNLHVLGQWICC